MQMKIPKVKLNPTLKATGSQFSTRGYVNSVVFSLWHSLAGNWDIFLHSIQNILLDVEDVNLNNICSTSSMGTVKLHTLCPT